MGKDWPWADGLLRVGDEYMGIHYTILSPFDVYLKFSILGFFQK